MKGQTAGEYDSTTPLVKGFYSSGDNFIRNHYKGLKRGGSGEEQPKHWPCVLKFSGRGQSLQSKSNREMIIY